MRIIVKCFAGCKDAVGAAAIILEIPTGSTVGEAFIKLIENYPALEYYKKSIMLAVNRQYADRQVQLKENDELACIPPVSGGNQVC